MEPDFQLKEKMVFKSLIFLYVNFVGSFGQYFKLLIKFKRLVFFIKKNYFLFEEKTILMMTPFLRRYPLQSLEVD